MLKKKLSYKISYMNFIMACAIVAMHSSCINGLYQNKSLYNVSRFIQTLIVKTTASAVPLFFIMSAFLLFRNYELKSYKEKVSKRIRSLIFPYLLWSIIGWSIYCIMTHAPVLKSFIDQTPVSLNMIDIIQAVALASYNAPIWFIRALFALVIFSPIIYFALKIGERLKALPLIILVLLATLYHFYRFSYSSWLFWLPEYYTGAWLAWNSEKLKEEWYVVSKAKSMIFIIAGVAAAVFVTIAKIDEYSTLYYFYRYAIAVISWYAFDIIGDYWNKRPGSVVSNAFFMFLSHSIIIMVLRKVLLKKVARNNILVLLTYVVVVILVIGIINIVAEILKKRLPSIWKVMVGGRL